MNLSASCVRSKHLTLSLNQLPSQTARTFYRFLLSRIRKQCSRFQYKPYWLNLHRAWKLLYCFPSWGLRVRLDFLHNLFPSIVVFISSYMIELRSASAVIILAGKPDLLRSHHRPARWSDRSSDKTASG